MVQRLRQARAAAGSGSLAWPARRLAGWLLGPALDVVYSERYALDLPGIDAQRGERILVALDTAGLLRRHAVHRAEAASFRDLRRIHGDAYLDSLADPAALLPVFGMELPDYAIERALEGQRAMVGGTMLAAELALASGWIAANLGGGLHHAFADRGERFCILNDVAVAIAGLRAAGYVEPILVVDLDLHDDDGTRSIFAHDRTVYTFSLHNRTTCEITAEAATAIELGEGVGDRVYLEAIDAHLPGVFSRFKPALVFYLAGCDPAADDTLGNWRISAAGMLRRDRMVIELARRPERRLPVVIVLAGGYGQRAWRYSARFLSTLRRGGRPVEPPTTNEVTLTRYRRLARQLFGRGPRALPAAAPAVGSGRPAAALGLAPAGAPPARASATMPEPGASGASGASAASMAAAAQATTASDGTRSAAVPDWELSEEDLLPSLQGPHRPRRLLGFFTRAQLELTLERVGLLERLRQLGFPHPTVEIDLEHPGGETVRVHGDHARTLLLAELRLRIDRRTEPGLALLRIEWLLLQNPLAPFTPARPRLPGQEHPGLGLLRDTLAMLVVLCEQLQLDGLLWVPGHFHTAVQGRRTGAFLDPADEGLFRSLEKAVAGLPLPAADHAVESGQVVDAASGEAFAWHPMPVVVPVSERLRQRIGGGDYERAAAGALKKLHLPRSGGGTA
jgi:acetoin utilization deacetylase AcuC-like enzyme